MPAHAHPPHGPLHGARGPCILVAVAAWAAAVACGFPAAPPLASPAESRIGRIRPRCLRTTSCVLGYVVTADGGRPVPRAAVFLSGRTEDGQVVRRVTRTDDEGVFTVADPPRGTYRLAVYHDAVRVEARGMDLGEPGTTVVPVRLAVP